MARRDSEIAIGTDLDSKKILDPNSEDQDAPPHHSWASLFYFTRKRHTLALTSGIFLSVASGLVIPAMAVVMGKTFGTFAAFGAGNIAEEEVLGEVTEHVMVLAGLGAAGWLLNGGFFACWMVFGELQAGEARGRLFEGLVGKEMEWYDMRKSGVASLISRVQSQIKELQTAVSQPLGFCIQSMTTAIVCLTVAIYTCWSLTIVILLGMPLALGFLAIASTRIQPHITTQKTHLSRATQSANRAFTAIETVKAFNSQLYERQLFASAAALAAKAYREQAIGNACIIAFIRLITLSMFVQGFWYGSKLVREGKVGAEEVMTTFWSCLMGTQNLEVGLAQMMVLEKGRAAAVGLRMVVGKVEGGKGADVRGGIVPEKCEGEIRIHDISFAYPSRPDQLALDSASFCIPAHQTTFIIGKSGSGKSTLGNLLLRAYEPLSGSIIFDGNPLQSIDSEWLWNNVTLLQQQTVLFNETIFRNIAFGRKDYENATREQVRESCRMVMLEDTLLEFPLGLETVVGVGGAALSGGQRQRVAIARTIIRNAPILILDEATSALDYVTRTHIMEYIHTWRKGKTTIIITHDIAQINPGHFVYVLEKGRVIQDGYRSDLEHQTGPFRSFVEAFDTREKVRRCSLIPELEPDYDSDDNYSVDGLVERGGLTVRIDRPFSYPPVDLEAQLAEPKATRLKRAGAFSPSMGIEMAHLHGPTPRAEGPRILTHRLRGKRSHFQHLPDSPTSDTSPTAPISRTRRVARSFESKDTTLVQIFITIWPSLSPKSRCCLVMGFSAAFVHAAATPAFSFALAQLLRSFFEPGHLPSESASWSLIVLGIAAADAINSYLVHYLLESVAQSWVDSLRNQALSRILSQPRVWFDENPVGAISEDLEKNAEEMKNLLGRFAGHAFVGTLMLVIGVCWSFTVSWQLTAVGLAIAPVMYAITRGFTWVSDRWERRGNEKAERVGAVFEETITNLRTVRSLALERYFRGKYTRATDEAAAVGMKRSLFAGVGFGLADSTIMFASALIFWYGAVLVAGGVYSLGDILTVFTVLLFSLAGANTFIGFIPQISNSKDTARRVLRLYHLPTNSHETHGASHISIGGAISLKSVSFAYPSRPDTNVLRNLTLDIAAGECVAITGVSGSGKSTLSALLLRLYPYTDGTITVDGVPIQSLDTCSLRAQMAVVSQTTVLFPSSVHDNISYGGTYSRYAVEQAAKAADIHEFVMSLPEGYNTPLGDNGSHLSGGQAQRIAIARALIRRPRILVLDECTSNLDSESARKVKETIGRLVEEGRGMTVVMITHSREMMRCAERVVVLSYGEVLETGGVDELVGRRGELWRLLERGEGEGKLVVVDEEMGDLYRLDSEGFLGKCAV